MFIVVCLVFHYAGVLLRLFFLFVHLLLAVVLSLVVYIYVFDASICVLFASISSTSMDDYSYTIPSGKRLHNYGKSPFSMGKSTINGTCSIAMLNYQGVPY